MTAVLLFLSAIGMLWAVPSVYRSDGLVPALTLVVAAGALIAYSWVQVLATGATQ